MTFTPTPHPPYQWHDTPAIDTPLNEAHLEAAETDIIAYVQGQLIALDALVEGLMETPANKDVANGYAGLDAGAKLKTSELPLSVVSVGSTAPGSGNTGDWVFTRNDGTMMRGAPAEISVDAWGTVAQPLGSGTADDLVPLTNALNYASAIGAITGAPCRVYFTPGKTYALSAHLEVGSYVDIWAYGAGFKRLAGFTEGRSIFMVGLAGGGKTRVALRGATLIGTGSESEDQGLFGATHSTFLLVEDNYVSGAASSPIRVTDSQYVWINRNKLINVTTFNHTNAINLISGNTGNVTPLKHIWVTNNHIEGIHTIGVCFFSASSNRVDAEVDAHVVDNTVVLASDGVWGMAIEQNGAGSPAPNVKGFDFSGNRIVGGAGCSYGIVISTDGIDSNDPLCMSEITISNNRIDVSANPNGRSILCKASIVTITGNTFKSGLDDIQLITVGSATLHHHTITGNTGRLGTGQFCAPASATAFTWQNFVAKGNARSGPGGTGFSSFTVPASGVPLAGGCSGDRLIYVTSNAGGPSTWTNQDGSALTFAAGTTGTILNPTGQTITPTYTSAPTASNQLQP